MCREGDGSRENWENGGESGGCDQKRLQGMLREVRKKMFKKRQVLEDTQKPLS